MKKLHENVKVRTYKVNWVQSAKCAQYHAIEMAVLSFLANYHITWKHPDIIL